MVHYVKKCWIMLNCKHNWFNCSGDATITRYRRGRFFWKQTVYSLVTYDKAYRKSFFIVTYKADLRLLIKEMSWKCHENKRRKKNDTFKINNTILFPVLFLLFEVRFQLISLGRGLKSKFKNTHLLCKLFLRDLCFALFKWSSTSEIPLREDDRFALQAEHWYLYKWSGVELERFVIQEYCSL